MPSPHLSASALIDAPPPQVYAILADYHQGHPAILPRPPFVSLVVEAGGIGAGTRFLAHIRVLGQLQSFRGVVSEPEPGRVLVETNNNGTVTSFTVEPRGEGRQSFVTIATTLGGRRGPLGALERWLTTRLLRPVYVQELAQLAAVSKASLS